MDNNMDDQAVHQMAEAFRKVLSEGAPEGEGQRAILVKRIPIICNDILSMKSDLRWIKWIGMGFVTATGFLALKALGI